MTGLPRGYAKIQKSQHRKKQPRSSVESRRQSNGVTELGLCIHHTADNSTLLKTACSFLSLSGLPLSSFCRWYWGNQVLYNDPQLCLLLQWNLHVYNGHPWDHAKWLLYRGDLLIEVGPQWRIQWGFFGFLRTPCTVLTDLSCHHVITSHYVIIIMITCHGLFTLDCSITVE